MRHGTEDNTMAKLRQRMLAVARRYLNNNSEAEDAVHDTMLRLLQRVSVQSDDFVPIAIVAVRNHAINMLHSRRATSLPDERTPDTSASPLQQLMADESRSLTETIISQLPPMQQVVMRMCHDDGLTNSEIATLTGLTDSAVRQHLSRARRKILTALTQHELL